MPTFSPTDAALEGFRITRERPWAVAAWAGLYLLVGLASGLLMIMTVGPKFALLQAAKGATDPAAAAVLFETLAPFYALAAPLGLAFQSIIICAVYRAVLKPEDLTRGYVKAGRAELRMMILSLIMALIGASALFILLFVDGLAAMALRPAAGPAGDLAAFFLAGASLCVLVWIMVRLSLAAPMTFMTGELHIVRAWPLTRGYFWRLFGAYALAAILAAITLLLAMIMFGATAGALMILAGGSAADIGRVFQPDATSIKAFFTPAMILYQLFWAAVMAVCYTVTLSPSAVAYAALGRPTR